MSPEEDGAVGKANGFFLPEARCIVAGFAVDNDARVG